MPGEKESIVQKDAKHKIFEAAAELFARDGYYKTSVREICKVAKVTKPVMYYYFNDKESLLEALVIETHTKVDELMKTHIGASVCMEDVLKGLINLYVDFVSKYPHLTKFSAFLQTSNVPQKILEIKIDRYKSEMKKFELLISQAQMNGVIINICSPEILTKNFIGTIIMILSEFLIIDKKVEILQQKLNSFVEFWIKTFIKEDCSEKL